MNEVSESKVLCEQGGFQSLIESLRMGWLSFTQLLQSFFQSQWLCSGWNEQISTYILGCGDTAWQALVFGIDGLGHSEWNDWTLEDETLMHQRDTETDNERQKERHTHLERDTEASYVDVQQLFGF